ncbi:hypothetical protein GCM10010433_69750 [Streptomyces pulveraceus]|uniref:Class I SAM-dependent methyltransferase n=1 Tax=Streptomyces pulveraceus TaxID=68258 RepID=A0ABW1GFT3_9ACTN
MTTARTPVRTGAAQRLAALAEDALGGPRLSAPAAQARLRGGPHGKARDRASISHHHDLSDDFYRLPLDGTMAHSCGSWTDEGPELTLYAAEEHKARVTAVALAREQAAYVRGQVVGLLEAAGPEARPVESMRAHYARVIDARHRAPGERWEESVLRVVRPKAGGDSGVTGAKAEAEAAHWYRQLEGR